MKSKKLLWIFINCHSITETKGIKVYLNNLNFKKNCILVECINLRKNVWESPWKRQTLTLKPYLDHTERCSTLLYIEVHEHKKKSFYPCLAVDVELMIRHRIHLFIFINLTTKYKKYPPGIFIKAFIREAAWLLTCTRESTRTAIISLTVGIRNPPQCVCNQPHSGIKQLCDIERLAVILIVRLFVKIGSLKIYI